MMAVLRARLAGLVAVLLLGAALAGCQGMELPEFLRPAASATPAPQVTATETEPPTRPAAPTATPTRPGGTLTLWVPPQFDPQSRTAAGMLLADRLEQFADEVGGVEVQVRVKAASGPAGLLESLSTTSAAAPGALPDLVALPRSAMEAAALKGLLVPLSADNPALSGTDWFPYARDLAAVEGSYFGLPFAGDALALLYRPSQVGSAPEAWTDLLAGASPLAFPAADPEALLTLALYQAEGGTLQDETGRPVIQTAQLARVLEIYAVGAQNGIFPAWMTELAADEPVWRTYSDGTAGLAVTWLSHFLRENPPDSAALPLLPGSAGGLTLADGWLWCLPGGSANPAAERLAEYLVEPDFLASWNEAAGVLPTRPSALSGWAGSANQALIERVAGSARARPANDLLFSLGPVLKEAAVQVLQGSTTPADAAAAAAERLNTP